MRVLFNGRRLWLVCAVALAMSGCFFAEKQSKTFGTPDDGTGGSTVPPPPSAINRAPTISGSPATALRVGETYSFLPNASDADGDPLTFSIENRPQWASFNTATGRLTGTPTDGDVGQFINVRIAVSDGKAQASLNAFQIEVSQVAEGSVTVSWMPPSTNANGSPLLDLAGYRIYYGRTPDSLDQVVQIGNTGTTRWVVENLVPATWYFTMTSYNTSGLESSRSSVVAHNLT